MIILVTGDLKGLLLAIDVSTTWVEAIFRGQWPILVSWKFKNLCERFDWSIDRVAIGKPMMWLAVKTSGGNRLCK